ncbi:MAG: hypothetical protein Q8Q09_11890 [Deltaproteobacteria bacterium]|nr:hypothetical protein [Deltaproteobacteria bacterium]
MIRSLAVLALCGVSLSCAPESGRPPPLGTLHFPTLAVASPDGRFLYVANSNFNLEFSGALLQRFDLDAIRARARARQNNGNLPEFEPNEALFVSSDRGAAVRLGSYVTGLKFSPDHQRLYSVSRGTGCVTWMDVGADGGLECGQSGVTMACDTQAQSSVNHCVGSSRTGPRNLLLPINPTSLDVSTGPNNDRYLTITHHEETRSRFSLMVDRGTAGPVMSHFAGEFQARLWTQLRLPGPDHHWLVFTRDEPSIGHARVFEDGLSSFVYRGSPTVPTTVSSELGVIDVTLDPCNPTRAYIASRARRGSRTSGLSGDALLALDVSNPAEPRVIDQLSMPIGPSRVVPVRRGATCAEGTDLYVVLYDSRKIYVVDAERWRETAQIRTQFGPTDLIVDPRFDEADHHFLYLINFSSMCIEVIDPVTRRVLFTVGEPIRPRELT